MVKHDMVSFRIAPEVLDWLERYVKSKHWPEDTNKSREVETALRRHLAAVAPEFEGLPPLRALQRTEES